MNKSHTPTIFLCILVALCEGIDLQVAGVAAPGISGELNPGPTMLGYFFSASTVGLLIGALTGGYFADRIGRKQVLVFSVAVFGLFSLLTTFAWDAQSLILVRLLTGIGLGGAYPNMIALASEASADNRRNANVALVFAGTPIGGAIISLGSGLVATEHWRWLFAFGGFAPLVIVPIMVRFLRESEVFTALRTVSLEVGNDVRKATGNAFTALMRDGRALRTTLLWLSFIFTLCIQYLMLSWLPILLIGSGLSKQQASFGQIGYNVGGAIAAILIGRLLEGAWRKTAVVVAFISLPLLMATLANVPPNALLMALVATGVGCAIQAGMAFLYAAAPISYPTAIRATGLGAAVGAGRVGSISGPLIGGALVTMGHSSSQLLIDLTPIAVCAAVCAIALVSLKLKNDMQGQS